MKMYAVEFFKLNMGTQNYIYNNNDSKQYIKLGNNNVIIAQETDLETLKEFGGGIKSLKYVGELFENKNESLGIKIHTEVTGLEEANILAKKLKNTIDSMKINLKVC